MKILFVSFYYDYGSLFSTNGLINFLSIYYDRIIILCHWNFIDFIELMYAHDDTINTMSYDYFLNCHTENKKFFGLSINENTFDFISLVYRVDNVNNHHISVSQFLDKHLPGKVFYAYDNIGTPSLIGKEFGFHNIAFEGKYKQALSEYDNCSYWFYNCNGMPHDIKYKNFMFNRLYEDENKLFDSLNIDSDYVAICEYSSPYNIEDQTLNPIENLIDRKYLNDKDRIINLHNLSAKYLDILKVVENAKEVHLIENSVALFIYFMQISGRMKKVPIKLHAYARKEIKRDYKINPHFLNMFLNPKLDNWEFIY